MPYGELLKALDDEVTHEVEKLHLEAAAQERQILDAARRQITAAHAQALAELERRSDAETDHAVALAHLEGERALLVATHRALATLRAELTTRVARLGEVAITLRLSEEVLARVTQGKVELHVASTHAGAVRKWLRRRRSSREVSVCPDTGITAGARAHLVDERVLLDNTVPSRLERAWRAMETEIAHELLGGSHAEL